MSLNAKRRRRKEMQDMDLGKKDDDDCVVVGGGGGGGNVGNAFQKDSGKLRQVPPKKSQFKPQTTQTQIQTQVSDLEYIPLSGKSNNKRTSISSINSLQSPLLVGKKRKRNKKQDSSKKPSSSSKLHSFLSSLNDY